MDIRWEAGNGGRVIEDVDVDIDSDGYVMRGGERVLSIHGNEVHEDALFRVVESGGGLVFVRDTLDETLAAEEMMLDSAFREVQ